MAALLLNHKLPETATPGEKEEGSGLDEDKEEERAPLIELQVGADEQPLKFNQCRINPWLGVDSPPDSRSCLWRDFNLATLEKT